jgi:stage II sporulation protein AA (anti-sigma F factor antagonist)
MSFCFEIHNNTVWAAIDGEVDMNVAARWREVLDKELAASMARNLTFDFSEVRFIDSSGLGVVLGRYKRVLTRGGKVRIVGANPQVYRILCLSGFGKLMEIEPPGEPKADKQSGGNGNAGEFGKIGGKL